MTDTQGGEAAEVVTTGAVDNAPQERDYEAEAREQGWVPEAEFKGEKKPKKFLSAEEFVDRGEFADSIRSKLENKFDQRLKGIERVNSKTVEQLQQQYERQINDLKAEKKAAIKEGDADRVEQIESQIDKIKDKQADAPEKSAATKAYDDFDDNYAPKTQEEPEFKVLKAGFFKANPWMIDEPDMAAYATEVSALNAEANPDIGFKANMKYVVDRVRKKFPAYFADIKETAANGHAAVDGGGSGGGPLRSSRALDSLPNEARAQAASDMKKFPKIYPTADAWIKAYNG